MGADTCSDALRDRERQSPGRQAGGRARLEISVATDAPPRDLPSLLTLWFVVRFQLS